MSGSIGGQFAQVPVFNAIIPAEGPKALPVDLDFELAGSWAIDLSQAFALKVISLIQAVYIDNSKNPNALELSVDSSRHSVTCPPYSQAFFPLLAPKDTKLTVASGLTGRARVFFLNIPVSPQVWGSKAPAFNFDASGRLLVSDPDIGTAVQAGYLQVALFGRGTVDVAQPIMIGNGGWQVWASAAGNTSLITTGSYFFVTHLYAHLSPDATRATAGVITVDITSGTFSLMKRKVFVGAEPSNTPLEICKYENIQYMSKAPGDPLRINLSAALTTGAVEVNVFGGTTAVQG